MSESDITARVCAAFARSGMTRAEMAAACRVTKTAVLYWLNGDRIPNRDSLAKFAKACRVEVAYFYAPSRRGKAA